MTSELEQARLQVSRLSPLNDTLNLCLEWVDESNLERTRSAFIIFFIVAYQLRFL